MERLRLTRRKFFEASAGTAASVAFFGQFPNLVTAPSYKDPTVFEVFGIHDTPNVGGSRLISVAGSDLTKLGCKFSAAIDPSESYISEVTERGIRLITRTYSEDNRFLGERTEKAIKKVKNFPGTPLVVPFNEVNLLSETGGKTCFLLPSNIYLT